MNAIFTIAAKNYLAQARTLGDSLKKTNPGLPFTIFLSDEAEGVIDLQAEKHNVVESRQLGMPRFKDMAFKYDVLEYSCDIKPFCFEYLYREGYDRAIYLDPDIYVYRRLDPIYALLEQDFLVLTPHITRLNLYDNGSVPENVFLFSGTFNLGFAALKDCEQGRSLLEWWKYRLENKGYVDRIEAYHVDQKWMDLVPYCFEQGVHVSRDVGINASHWNMHERQLQNENGEYFVNGRPLIFFHFSSFDPNNPAGIARRQERRFTLENNPEYRELFEYYACAVLENGYDTVCRYPYAYTKFDNGVTVLNFHRRLYRRLSEEHSFGPDPFVTTPGSFFDLLKINKLLIHEEDRRGEYSGKDFSNPGVIIRWFRRGMLWLKKLVGIKYYHMLLRQLFKYSRPEEQVFLIEKWTIEQEQNLRQAPISGNHR